MEPLNITILIVIGMIGWLVNAVSLIAAVPFFPLVFPIIPVAAVLAGIYLFPQFRPIQPPPSAADEPSMTRWQKTLRWSWNYLPYLAVVPGVALLIFLPSLQFGYHGPFHSSYFLMTIVRRQKV